PIPPPRAPWPPTRPPPRSPQRGPPAPEFRSFGRRPSPEIRADSSWRPARVKRAFSRKSPGLTSKDNRRGPEGNRALDARFPGVASCDAGRFAAHAEVVESRRGPRPDGRVLPEFALFSGEEKSHLNAGQRRLRSFRPERSRLARHRAAESLPAAGATSPDHDGGARGSSMGAIRPPACAF